MGKTKWKDVTDCMLCKYAKNVENGMVDCGIAGEVMEQLHDCAASSYTRDGWLLLAKQAEKRGDNARAEIYKSNANLVNSPT